MTCRQSLSLRCSQVISGAGLICEGQRTRACRLPAIMTPSTDKFHHTFTSLREPQASCRAHDPLWNQSCCPDPARRNAPVIRSRSFKGASGISVDSSRLVDLGLRARHFSLDAWHPAAATSEQAAGSRHSALLYHRQKMRQSST